MSTIYERRQDRRGTAANLAQVNEVLLQGERCYETDTGKWKLGDGVTRYNDLPYQAGDEAALSATFVGRGDNIINVDDHGAVGDAATDDTAAINDAVAALGGGTGTIIGSPGKTYLVNTGVTSLGGTAVGAVTLRDNQVLRDIALKVTATNVTAACAVGATNVHFHNITVTGTPGSGFGNGLALRDCTDSAITNNRIDSCESQGIDVGSINTGCTDILVAGNRVTNCTNASTGCGIVASKSARVRVTDNGSSGNRIGISGNDLTDSVIAGNTADANTIGITIDGVVSGAGLSARNTVTGNTASNNTNASYSGIYLGNKAADTVVSDNTCTGNSGRGIYVYNAGPAILSGNAVEGNGLSGVLISSSPGPHAITGNEVRGNQKNGIDLFHTSDVAVVGNAILNNDLAGGNSGVRVFATSSVVLDGNRIGNHTYEVQVNKDATASTDVSLGMNNLTGTHTQAVYDPNRVVTFSNHRLWVSATAFAAVTAQPSLGAVANRPAWLMDASANEQVAATFSVPEGWHSYDVDLHWTNASAGAGDAVWQFVSGEWGDGETLTAGERGAILVTATAPAQNVLRVTRLGFNVPCSGGGRQSFTRIYRVGSNASDTLPNDAALLGVVLTRTS